MPRQARLDAPGTLHHVIIRGTEGDCIFRDGKDRQNFLSRVGQISGDTRARIVAWTLMDTHVHILMFSGPPGLSRFMRRLLTGYAVWYNRRHHRSGHLFQNRYKSIVCEEDAYLLELVRYIHLNPLRAAIVKNLGDFVGQILKEADKRLKRQLQMGGKKDSIDQVIKRLCKEGGIEEGGLRSGGKRRKVSEVRAKISFQLSQEMGIPFAEIARHVGVCTSAVAKAVQTFESAG